MPGARKPPEGHQTEQVATAVRELTEQLEVLRNVLDNIRETFVWAVRNDKLCSPDRSQDSLQSPELSIVPRLELDEEQVQAIAEAVHEGTDSRHAATKRPEAIS